MTQAVKAQSGEFVMKMSLSRSFINFLRCIYVIKIEIVSLQIFVALLKKQQSHMSSGRYLFRQECALRCIILLKSNFWSILLIFKISVRFFSLEKVSHLLNVNWQL